jgi:hemerythrin superfamily protein
MDAIALLKGDHREVEALFKAFERSTAAGERKKIARKIITALSIHAVVEEQLLYPLLREEGIGDEDDVLEALEEHHVTKVSLLELDSMTAKEERFAPKVRVLAEMVRQHVAEEEKGMFPKLRGIGAARLKELGAALEQAKKVAPTHPHPASPDEPPGNVVVGALMALYDRSKDAVKGVASRRR